MANSALIEIFLNHCAVERGLSKNTIAAYRRDLNKFNEFIIIGLINELLAIRLILLSPSKFKFPCVVDEKEFPLGLFTKKFYQSESDFAKTILTKLSEVSEMALSETEVISLKLLKLPRIN